MRFSFVLVSLALLFCISSVSAENLLAGRWTLPYARQNVSEYCCIPSVIEVTCSGNTGDDCNAHYYFPSDDSNSTCWNLFNNEGEGLLLLHYRGDYEYYFSEPTYASNMTFNFRATSTEGLKIWSSESIDQCDFTMVHRDAPVNLSTGPDRRLPVIIIVLVVIIFCFCKKSKKSQGHVVLEENVEQQHVYVDLANQQFVQQQPQRA